MLVNILWTVWAIAMFGALWFAMSAVEDIYTRLAKLEQKDKRGDDENDS